LVLKERVELDSFSSFRVDAWEKGATKTRSLAIRFLMLKSPVRGIRRDIRGAWRDISTYEDRAHRWTR